MRLTRRIPLLALLCAATLHAQTPLAATIGSLLADPKVEGVHWGISVTQLDGTPLYALDDDKLFQPASNNKIFTTATALAVFDPGQTFETDVIARGRLSADGHLRGNLTLLGAGDANLSGRTIPYTHNSKDADPLRYLDDLAAQIARTGLKTVDGDIIGDDTRFLFQPILRGWNADDLAWGYGAPISALSIGDNQLKFTLRPGAQPGQPATITLETPQPAYYTITTNIITGTINTPTVLRADRLPGSRTVRLYGSIAFMANPDVEYLSIDDPAEYAAIALKYLLARHGVTVTGTARAQHRLDNDTRSLHEEWHEQLPVLPETQYGYEPKPPATGIHPCPACAPGEVELIGRILARHTSPTVLQDVTVTNKVSQNLHAELLLRQLGAALGDDGSASQGIRVVHQFALNAGVADGDFTLSDGSGLSNYDLVTPRAITQILRYAATKPWGADFRSTLPIGGVDGTLHDRFTKPPLKGNVIAKTGTLGEDRALSGYLVCASGKTVVFSILTGNHLPGTDYDRTVMDKIVAAIAAAN
jgi:D-alanyl-D-alanine carboxypeptidase/D-alanyl-D-alanine-endopeptidase (penicillin-binding protein 4)